MIFLNRLTNEEKVLKYYFANVKLKELVRTGWINWKVSRDRLESVAEHIELGTKDETYKYGRMIKIRVTGAGFLYNMVRIIAGTLLDIGNGLLDVDVIDKCLETHDRADAGPTAPASGLTITLFPAPFPI